MFVFKRLYSRIGQSNKYLKPSKLDPGIHHQKQAVKTDPDDNDEIEFEELESDFMSVNKTHREHMEEVIALKEREKYLIVRNKHFKEKYPNFLTWHNKEQIRYLYNSDPEEWTVEKLSEGFPALPDVIWKIIKGKWTKKNINRIQAHDKGVLDNWNEFKTGKLNNLPDDLKKHLEKFTDRTVSLKDYNLFELSKNKTLVKNRDHRIQGEFSEIITSYEKLKNKNTERTNKEQTLFSTSVEYTKLQEGIDSNQTKSKKSDKNLVTLKELRSNIEKKSQRGQNLTMEEELLVKAKTIQNNDQDSIVEVEREQFDKIVENKHNTGSQVGFLKKTAKDFSHLVYPEKITIPKNIYKKGYTYRLNDCYYDCDGEFLYRVPGMDK